MNLAQCGEAGDDFSRACTQCEDLFLEEIVGWILKFLGVNFIGMCLFMQCSKESPNPAGILLGFIMIAFVYLLSIACSGSYFGSGEHLQPSAVALFIVAYAYLYLVMYAG